MKKEDNKNNNSLTASQVLELTEGIVGKLHERVDGFEEILSNIQARLNNTERQKQKIEKVNKEKNSINVKTKTFNITSDVPPDRIHKAIEKEVGSFLIQLMKRYPIDGVEIDCKKQG